METRADLSAHALHQEGANSPGDATCRPWSYEEDLWLRILKTPEEHLRPCDWAFLDARLRRPRKEVRRQLVALGLSNFGRRYSVNEAFFETWTRASAWVLGLLMADGHLGRTGASVHYSSTDRELVEKVRACMEATHTIYVSTGGVGHLGNKPLHIVDLNRRRIRSALDALVGGRLKSERVRVPNVPRTFLLDFTRGYFEGDGSIFFDQPRSNTIVQISGLTAFIEDLRSRLVEVGVLDRAYIRRCPQARDTSTLSIDGAKAFYLAHLMYQDAPAGLVLERKRAVYLRALEWRRARGLALEARHV
jgi:hypothetical protein